MYRIMHAFFHIYVFMDIYEVVQKYECYVGKHVSEGAGPIPRVQINKIKTVKKCYDLNVTINKYANPGRQSFSIDVS